MKLTLKPMISFRQMLKNVFSPNTAFFEYWAKDNEEYSLYGKSTYALLSVIYAQEVAKGASPKIWFPKLICRDVVDPLIRLGFKVGFYNFNVDKGFRNVSDSLQGVQNGVDVVVYVHYFGSDHGPLLADFSEYCKSNELLLIEDAAHCCFRKGSVGKYGNFTYFSLHKHFPVEGMSILVRHQKSQIEQLSNPALQEKLTASGFSSPNSRITNDVFLMLKELVKRFVGSRNYKFQDSSAIKQQTGRDLFSFPINTSNFSKFLVKAHSEKLFKSDNKERVMLAYSYLLSLLKEGGAIEVETGNMNNCYLFPIRLKDERDAKSLVDIGVPLVCWPDLPADSGLDLEITSSIKYYVQVNPLTDLRYIYKIIDKFKDPLSFRTGMEVELYEKIIVSPFVQSYSYSKAKSQSSRQSLIKLKFDYGNISGAITSYMRRLSKKVVSINILSFGPVLPNNASFSDVQSYFRSIATRYGNWIKGNLLIVSPYMALSGQSDYVLWKSGFVRLPFIPTWTSAKLRIGSNGLDQLRSQLHKKWRNQLNKSLKNDFSIEETTNSDVLKEIHKESENFLKSIGIEAISSDVFEYLLEDQEHSDASLKGYVALKDAQIIGGVIVAETEFEATYLIGWSSELGKTLYVNQSLLWRSIESAKESGKISFDLGGIDFVNSPGVAKYKSYLNGENYQLVGTYLYVPLVFRHLINLVLK